MKRAISLLLAIVLCVGLIPGMVFAAENPFTDVIKGKFYYDAVLWAVSEGITTGKTDTTFDPSGECTRAQVVTFLWRYAGKPAPKSSENPFPDVPAGKYYTEAVLWAVEQGITGGFKDGTFGPAKTCTRDQIVTFLWRFAGEPALKSMENPFPDVKTDAFYGKAVLWAVENSITGGFKDGTFGPTKTCTRDQIVTFLYRYDALKPEEKPEETEPSKPAETEPTLPQQTEPQETEPQQTEPTVPPTTEPTEPVELTIKTQPQNAPVAVDEKAVFSVEAVGGKAPYTYLWEYAKPDKWKFYPLTDADSAWAGGNDTDTLSVYADQLMISEKHRFRCVVQDAEGTIITSEYAELCTLPLTIQEGSPEDVKVNIGNAVNISVYVKGGTPAEFGGYYYQWQYATKMDPEFKDITDADTWANGYNMWYLQVYVSKQLMDDAYQFRCVIKDADGTTVASRAANLLKGPSVRFETQPKNAYAEASEAVTFTVKAADGGVPYAYQWEYLDGETQEWAELIGETGTELTVTYAPEVTDSYRCVVTDAGGETVVSEVARIISPLKILSQPKNDPAGIGSEAITAVIVDGGEGELNYQWQYAATAKDAVKGNWKNTTGLEEVTIDNEDVTSRLYVDVVELDYIYRCVITRGEQTVTTRWVSFGGLRFGLEPVVPLMVKVGQTISLTAVGLGGQGELTYSWEMSVNGTTYVPLAEFNAQLEATGNPKPFTGEDTHTLSFKIQDESNGTAIYFRCVVEDLSNTIESKIVRIG